MQTFGESAAEGSTGWPFQNAFLYRRNGLCSAAKARLFRGLLHKGTPSGPWRYEMRYSARSPQPSVGCWCSWWPPAFSIIYGTDRESRRRLANSHASTTSTTNSRNPRHFNIIEGGRVYYQALHVDSKSVLDAVCRVKKCFRHSI